MTVGHDLKSGGENSPPDEPDKPVTQDDVAELGENSPPEPDLTDEEREAALQQRERVAAVRIPLEVEPFAVDVNRVHIGAALVGFVWFVRPVWVFAVRIPLKREPAAVVIQ